MKQFTFALLFAISCSQDQIKEENPLYTLTGSKWSADIDEAMKIALKEKKLILWIESIGRFECPKLSPCT